MGYVQFGWCPNLAGEYMYKSAFWGGKREDWHPVY